MKIEVPCKIGDIGYVIRKWRGIPHVKEGEITELYFSRDMKLCANIGGWARGIIGDKVFTDYKVAKKACEEMRRANV